MCNNLSAHPFVFTETSCKSSLEQITPNISNAFFNHSSLAENYNYTSEVYATENKNIYIFPNLTLSDCNKDNEMGTLQYCYNTTTGYREKSQRQSIFSFLFLVEYNGSNTWTVYDSLDIIATPNSSTCTPADNYTICCDQTESIEIPSSPETLYIGISTTQARNRLLRLNSTITDSAELIAQAIGNDFSVGATLTYDTTEKSTDPATEIHDDR